MALTLGTPDSVPAGRRLHSASQASYSGRIRDVTSVGQMHDLGIPCHLYAAKTADAAQIHQHVVLGQLFFVIFEFLFQRRVLRGSAPRGREPAMGLVSRVPFSSRIRG